MTNVANLKFLWCTFLFIFPSSILRLFTSYSNYIEPEVIENIKKVPLGRWLAVKPQLMVCLGIENEVVQSIVYNLIIEISAKYPEVIYKQNTPFLSQPAFYLPLQLFFPNDFS